MKKKIVGHDHCAQHTHHHQHAAFGQTGREQGTSHGCCINRNERKFVNERKADDGNKHDDGPLNTPVGVGKEQHDYGYGRQGGPQRERQTEKHVEGYGTAQNFGQRGGHRRAHGAPEQRARQAARQIARGGLGEAKTGNDAQVGNVVLQHDEHHGREGNHPKQGIAKIGSGRQIAGPVAGVNKTDRDEQARPDVTENVESAHATGRGMAPMVTKTAKIA